VKKQREERGRRIFDGDLCVQRITKGTIIANTRKTAVRIAYFSSSDGKVSNVATAVLRGNGNGIRGRVSTSTLDRGVHGALGEHFPIGEKMNEETHVFDHSFFEHGGKQVCFMAALPIETANELMAEAVKSGRRVEIIETIEHLIFRKFCPEYESALIFLPQDGGLRLLQIHENLPAAAHFISNNPAHRANELRLFTNSFGTSSFEANPFENEPKIALVENQRDFEWISEILPEISLREVEF